MKCGNKKCEHYIKKYPNECAFFSMSMIEWCKDYIPKEKEDPKYHIMVPVGENVQITVDGIEYSLGELFDKYNSGDHSVVCVIEE